MISLIDVGKRIKKLRNESGLTQSKIAEYLSLDQSMVAKMEKGDRNITADIIEKLSILYCCPIDYILYGESQEDKCTISFRTAKLNADDIKSLSIINRIAMNQFEMDKILGGE